MYSRDNQKLNIKPLKIAQLEINNIISVEQSKKIFRLLIKGVKIFTLNEIIKILNIAGKQNNFIVSKLDPLKNIRIKFFFHAHDLQTTKNDILECLNMKCIDSNDNLKLPSNNPHNECRVSKIKELANNFEGEKWNENDIKITKKTKNEVLNQNNNVGNEGVEGLEVIIDVPPGNFKVYKKTHQNSEDYHNINSNMPYEAVVATTILDSFNGYWFIPNCGNDCGVQKKEGKPLVELIEPLPLKNWSVWRHHCVRGPNPDNIDNNFRFMAKKMINSVKGKNNSENTYCKQELSTESPNNMMSCVKNGNNYLPNCEDSRTYPNSNNRATCTHYNECSENLLPYNKMSSDGYFSDVPKSIPSVEIQNKLQSTPPPGSCQLGILQSGSSNVNESIEWNKKEQINWNPSCRNDELCYHPKEPNQGDQEIKVGRKQNISGDLNQIVIKTPRFNIKWIFRKEALYSLSGASSEISGTNCNINNNDWTQCTITRLVLIVNQ